MKNAAAPASLPEPRPAPGPGPRLARPLALIGARGAGKTTVGRLLAARLGVPFVDLDDETVRVARAHGWSGPDAGTLLTEVGPALFRSYEAAAVRALLEPSQHLVLATGGGVVEHADSRAWLVRAATVVWLRATAETLATRISRDPTPRPALLGGDPVTEIPAILARREPHYARLADLVVDASQGSPDEVASRILTALIPESERPPEARSHPKPEPPGGG